MTATTLPVGLIVTVSPVRDGRTILLAICPYCDEVDPHRVRLDPTDSPIRDASCGRGQYRLKVHRQLAAGRHWEPGDPDSPDPDEWEPRWVD